MTIDDILADLYALDPALRDHDADLRRLVADIVAAKPDTHFDATFAARLRSRLSSLPRTSRFSLTSMQTMWSRYLLPLGAVAAVVLVAVVATSAPSTAPAGSVDSGTVVALGEHAFGSLGGNGDSSAPAGAPGTLSATRELALSAAPSPAPLVAQDNAVTNVATSAPAMVGDGTAGSAGTSVKMMAPDAMLYPYHPVSFHFTYKGDELPNIPAKLPVLRRGRPALAADGSMFANLVPGLNLSTLANLKVQNLNLVQDSAYGFMVSVDLMEGFVSLNQNYEHWPHPEQKCQDEACYERLRLSPSDVPPSDELVAIADRFLASIGISRDGYGDGQAQANNLNTPMPLAMGAAVRVADPATISTMPMYVPDSVQVIYPKMVNGTPAYDESGNPTGLSVSVHIREKRVDGMWGLDTAGYEKSDYAMETSAATIRKIAEQGGRYGYGMYVDPNAEVKEVVLSTPSLVLMTTWQYDGVRSAQLLVPALRFPVTSAPTEYYQKAIMVPLAADLLNQDGYNGGIVPMMKGVPTPTVAPAADAAPAVAPKPIK
jgi:hypothetical protein